jgi:hypothetical protein
LDANPLKDTVSTFEKALDRYGEALLFSGTHKPAGMLSFDKTVSNTISGKTYTFYGFDIWGIRNYFAGVQGVPQGYKGPLIYDLGYQFSMKPYSLIVQSCPEWQGVREDVKIEASRPVSLFIDLYLMIR